MLGVGGFFVAINTVDSDRENVEVVVEEEKEEGVPPPLCTLSVSINPLEGGSVSPPSGSEYELGTQVPLTVTPSPGYEFNHWSGTDDNSVNPTTVTMNSNRSITAYLSQLPPPQHTLTINVSGQGTINPSPGSHIYTDGYQVTITPSPASGYRFDYWSGEASGTSSTITVTMNSNMNITANFVKVRYTLSTSVSRGGSISIYPSSSDGKYDSATRVTLTATSVSAYVFDHWAGDAFGTSPTITITMDSNKSVIANFIKLYQRIEYIMPAGSIGGSEVIYSKTLKAGDKVDGFVQLTGEYHSIDWSYEWTFQIIGPGGESIHLWKGHWVNNNYHEFSFTASYAGTYKIRVYHASSYSKNLTIEIWPPGW